MLCHGLQAFCLSVPSERFCADELCSRVETRLSRDRYFLWYVPLEKWRTFESDAMPMHDWLFNQEYNLEQCLGEEGLASVFSVTNWRYAAVTLR
jgi:hypothetical protein